MIPFSRLIDALVFMPSRNGKLRLLGEYFATTQDPDRGWALAALTGNLDLPTAKPAMIRELARSRVDAELLEHFGQSVHNVIIDLGRRLRRRSGLEHPNRRKHELGAGRTSALAWCRHTGWLLQIDRLVTSGMRIDRQRLSLLLIGKRTGLIAREAFHQHGGRAVIGVHHG